MTISWITIIHKTFIECLTQYGLVLFVLFAFLATWHLPKGWVMVGILQSQCNRRVHCEETDYISQLITVQIFAVSWLTRFLSVCHHIYAMNHHTERWYYKICQLNKVGVMFCAFLNISTPIIIQSAISPLKFNMYEWYQWLRTFWEVFEATFKYKFREWYEWVGGVLWVELLFSNSVRNTNTKKE